MHNLFKGRSAQKLNFRVRLGWQCRGEGSIEGWSW